MKRFLTKLSNKLFAVSTMGMTVLAAAMPTAFAADGDAVGNAVLEKVIDLVENLFFYIGIILLVWSVGMLILAFKNEDADSKSRAIMLMVVAIALISIRFWLDPILTAAGFGTGGGGATARIGGGGVGGGTGGGHTAVSQLTASLFNTFTL